VNGTGLHLALNRTVDYPTVYKLREENRLPLHNTIVVDYGMSSIDVGAVQMFASEGVVLTGCGILMAMAGLFGWFAIEEKASAQPECHVPKETGQTVPSLLGGRLSQKPAQVERFRSREKRKGEKR
jgi:hypothetical protein